MPVGTSYVSLKLLGTLKVSFEARGCFSREESISFSCHNFHSAMILTFGKSRTALWRLVQDCHVVPGKLAAVHHSLTLSLACFEGCRPSAHSGAARKERINRQTTCPTLLFSLLSELPLPFPSAGLKPWLRKSQPLTD